MHNWKCVDPVHFNRPPTQAPARYKNKLYWRNYKGKSLQTIRVSCFVIFWRLKTWNLDFDIKWGLHSHRKKNKMHPLKSIKRIVFQTIIKDLNYNLNCGNGLICPRSISKDMKIVLKSFELITIWRKPFFLWPPFSPPILKYFFPVLNPRSFWTPQNRFTTPFSYGGFSPQLRELTI